MGEETCAEPPAEVGELVRELLCDADALGFTSDTVPLGNMNIPCPLEQHASMAAFVVELSPLLPQQYELSSHLVTNWSVPLAQSPL